ncbi:MAG: hypothetical protein Q8L27_00065 [archaeon]|nr:hypothetical protein [archaeon]
MKKCKKFLAIMDARGLATSLSKANGELAELRRTCKVLGLLEGMGTRRRFLL